jgi:hypothetical protein
MILKEFLGSFYEIFTKKIWICLMGLSLISQLARNFTFVADKKETVKAQIHSS